MFCDVLTVPECTVDSPAQLGCSSTSTRLTCSNDRQEIVLIPCEIEPTTLAAIFFVSRDKLRLDPPFSIKQFRQLFSLSIITAAQIRTLPPDLIAFNRQLRNLLALVCFVLYHDAESYKPHQSQPFRLAFCAATHS